MSSVVLAVSRRSSARSFHPLQCSKYVNILQGQDFRRLQQRRSYWFVPTTLAEARERFIRWTETAEQRTIRVQLVEQQQRELFLQQQQQELRNRRRPRWYRRPVEAIALQKTTDPVLYRHQKRLRHRRKKRQMLIEAIESTSVPAAAIPPILPLPHPTTRIRFRDRMRQWTRQKLLAVVEGDNKTGEGVRFIRDRYQFWKSKQRDRYQGWKLRRQEQWSLLKLSSVATMDRSMTNVIKLQRMMVRAKNRTNRMLRPIIWRTKHVTLTEYSRPEWFDSFGRPLTSRDATGRFVNPWSSQSTNGVQDLWKILAWKYLRINRHISEYGFFASLIPRLLWTETGYASPTTTMDDNAATVPGPPLPVPMALDKGVGSNYATDIIQTTWVGHSTCWVQLGGFSILTDPMFSLRASPYQNFPIGVPREIPPSHSIPELLDHYRRINGQEHSWKIANSDDGDDRDRTVPDDTTKMDICCISHDHYDHMDKDTVKALRGHVSVWVVPLGIKEWLVDDCDINPDSIVELEWWQEANIIKTTSMQPNDDGELATIIQVLPEDIANGRLEDDDTHKQQFQRRLTITCCPASHWAGRTVWDRNTRLWCSFAIKDSTPSEDRGANFFFCGDTGFPQFPIFRQIGDALGPFDFAALPIGAYEPRFMNQEAHIDPYEALQVHFQIKSKKSLGVHWGSFPLSEEGMDAPPKVLQDALQSEFGRLVKEHVEKLARDQPPFPASSSLQQDRFPTLPSLDFVTIGHGETIQAPVGKITTAEDVLVNSPVVLNVRKTGDGRNDDTRDPYESSNL